MRATFDIILLQITCLAKFFYSCEGHQKDLQRQELDGVDSALTEEGKGIISQL